MKIWIAASLALALTSCAAAPKPPEIVVDRTVCAFCGMFVSELPFAAASQIAGQDARVFDDIGCLLSAARQSGVPDRVWFHDFHTGQWIAAGSPVFVRAASLRAPMGGGVAAFGDRDAAGRFAAARGGVVIDNFGTLLGGSK